MRILVAFLLIASQAPADTSLTTLRLVRPATVLGAEDVGRLDRLVPGTLTSPDQAIGYEARVMLYPGRPILLGDVGPAALVERNQPVKLIYRTGGLTITTDGRALDRGASGEAVRVMNLASRTTISGTVQPDGSIQVGPGG
ncbi:flagellar basal body P-ring formation protein FlgA [Alphaproteobacteria bacterium GH1-50]|uniref:Flagella basal body P-ring formation protein FlgA n=1 Tax=Kangsaoukella pontilimi TaxID=2691042 RepID=A0A7C9MX69_9RHOB|nr:flagellar basal body P-ring formation chaperone FlgA [Kangsaoukella pontilimi]MXQ08174.1 flagellar basal body P-ring formation protein FlgA [Kangsaoukella pontilimi]